MLKGLRTNKRTTGRTGRIQTQSRKSISTSSRGNSRTRKIPYPADTLLALSVITRTTSKIRKIYNPSFRQLTSSIFSRKSSIPSFSSKFNKVLPSYKAIAKPKRVYRKRSSDDASVSNKEFDAYERLTGISKERPEVVLLSEFNPLFNKSHESTGNEDSSIYEDNGLYQSMTDTGLFVDTQIQSRGLRASNIITLFKDLQRYNYFFYNTYRTRRDKMMNSINDLSSMANFLLNVVRRMEIMKNHLDLRDSIHIVKPSNVIKLMTLDYTQTRTSWLRDQLQQDAAKYLPEQYDLTDILERLGYQKKMSKELFSSTKIWLQILEEYKDIIETHSGEFIDTIPISQRNDQSATVLNKRDVPTFKIIPEDPAKLPFLNEIVGFSPKNIVSATRTINRAYGKIYDRGVRFRNHESMISVLVNFISKEYRFSRGLREPKTKEIIEKYYKYNVTDGSRSERGRTFVGNASLFEKVIGKTTNNVVDFPDNRDSNSLTSLAHQNSQYTSNIGVMPFESKYIENDKSTMTPGSVYYVDELLRISDVSTVLLDPQRNKIKEKGPAFNTRRLTNLSNDFRIASDKFATVVDGLNLLGVSSSEPTSRERYKIGASVSNPTQLIDNILDKFIDNKGRTLKYVRNDRLTSLISLATRSKYLKSQLFLYFMNQVARSYSAEPSRSVEAPIIGDNTPFTDKMAEDIVKYATRLTRSSRLYFFTSYRNKFRRGGSVDDSNDVTSDVLVASLKKGTKLTSTINAILVEILNEFNYFGAITPGNDRTLFGGHMDTTLMMAVFDMIVHVVSKYGNQSMVGRSLAGVKSRRSSGSTTFFIALKNTNHRNSSNALINRLRKEQTLTNQITWAILNSLNKLSNSMTETINYCQSPYAIASLRSLDSIIDDDSELEHLMSEQQIMSLGTTVKDIIGRIRSKVTASPFNADVDFDRDFDSDDVIKIIDDSIVTPQLRDMLYGYFGQPEMAGEIAVNKRIMSVGLPLGFSRKLKQKVRTSTRNKTSYTDKQDDIIQLKVYKIDMMNQDIVFKPQSFLFEMSRFPVRNDSYIKNLPDNPTINDIAAVFPMRDFEESFEEGTSSVSYWMPGNDGIQGSKAALDAESYAFLTKEQKEEIVNNHLMSYMCEMYLKLLTGISTAEHVFDIDEKDKDEIGTIDEDFIKLIVEHKVTSSASYMSFNKSKKRPTLAKPPRPSTVSSKSKPKTRTSGVLFSGTNRTKLSAVFPNSMHSFARKPRLTSFSGVAGKVTRSTSYKGKVLARRKASPETLSKTTMTLSSAMNNLSQKRIYGLTQQLRMVSNFANMKSTLSDGLLLQKEILRPKQFDRVFNIIIDPDDFDIDYDKTVETREGRNAFQQLFNRGEIESSFDDRISRLIARRKLRGSAISPALSALRRAEKGQRPSDREANYFKFKGKDRGEGDVSFEKYFVTVETFGEEDV